MAENDPQGGLRALGRETSNIKQLPVGKVALSSAHSVTTTSNQPSAQVRIT
jgi:hypothetical protein